MEGLMGLDDCGRCPLKVKAFTELQSYQEWACEGVFCFEGTIAERKMSRRGRDESRITAILKIGRKTQNKWTITSQEEPTSNLSICLKLLPFFLPRSSNKFILTCPLLSSGYTPSTLHDLKYTSTSPVHRYTARMSFFEKKKNDLQLKATSTGR